MKKIIRYVDEDTLEIMERVVEDDIDDRKEMSDSNVMEMFKQALECEPEEFIKKYNDYKIAETEFKTIYESFKTRLLDIYEKHDKTKNNITLPKSIVIGNIKLTHVSPSVRNSIDNKKLKEEEPEIAKKYTKTTNVKASIRLEEVL